jgi:hypothetical protein
MVETVEKWWKLSKNCETIFSFHCTYGNYLVWWKVYLVEHLPNNCRQFISMTLHQRGGCDCHKNSHNNQDYFTQRDTILFRANLFKCNQKFELS